MAGQLFEGNRPGQMVELLDDLGDVFPAAGDAGAPRVSANVEAMLGGSDDDDPYSAPAAAPAAPPAPASALAAWGREIQLEIAKRDAGDQEFAGQLRESARGRLDEHYALLRAEQEKRAKLNQENEIAKLEELDRDTKNPWEKVGLLIDTQRTDLHVRDVSRMSSLLRKLKH
jgi:hypothetical protein